MTRFSVAVCKLAISRTAIASCNLLWVDLGIDPTMAHVPIKAVKVSQLADTLFSEPKHLLSNVHVAVPKSWASSRRSKNFDPLESRPWRRISAPEMLHALILAVSRDVQAQASEETLQKWLTILLSTRVEFQCVETDLEFHKCCTQLREAPGIEFDAVRCSALQRILDLSAFAIKLGVKDEKKIAKEYNSGLHLADASEQVSENLVKCAISLHNRIFNKSATSLNILTSLDSKYGVNSPLDSVLKLHVLLTKTQTVPKFEWTLELMISLFLRGKLGSADFSKRALTGGGNPARGTADVAMAKQEIRNYLLRWGDEEIKVPSSCMDQLREMSTATEKFREWVSSKATPWRATWPAAADALLHLVERMVFDVDYDEEILAWLRSRKALPELFESECLAEVMEEIRGKSQTRPGDEAPAEEDWSCHCRMVDSTFQEVIFFFKCAKLTTSGSSGANQPCRDERRRPCPW